ncbi:MAG: efflux RND transporter periplasmic adaptor subunit [Rhizobiaceae bacterium]
MAKFRFHKLAAIAVLVTAGVWVFTGDFTSVGSATIEETETAEKQAPEPEPVLRTVAYVVPPHINHARAIRLSGQTQSDKRADLATRAGGIIEKLPVEQGDWVESGDLILSLEAEEKIAMIETAKRLVTQRESELAATEALVKRGTLPTLRADTARSAIAAARSQLEAAQAELDRIRVLAPFAGYVDRVKVEQGSSVSQGAPVATLVSIDPILATGEISEHDLRHVKIGDVADVQLVDGSVIRGKLRYISREANNQTRTFPLEIAIANPEGLIPAGMTAEITLRGKSVDAVALPRSVVTLSGRGDLGIRILKADDTVDFVPIDLIDDTPDGLLLGGVPADARIIVAGQDLVEEGEKVQAVEADQKMIEQLIGEATGAVN